MERLPRKRCNIRRDMHPARRRRAYPSSRVVRANLSVFCPCAFRGVWRPDGHHARAHRHLHARQRGAPVGRVRARGRSSRGGRVSHRRHVPKRPGERRVRARRRVERRQVVPRERSVNGRDSSAESSQLRRRPCRGRFQAEERARARVVHKRARLAQRQPRRRRRALQRSAKRILRERHVSAESHAK